MGGDDVRVLVLCLAGTFLGAGTQHHAPRRLVFQVTLKLLPGSLPFLRPADLWLPELKHDDDDDDHEEDDEDDSEDDAKERCEFKQRRGT